MACVFLCTTCYRTFGSHQAMQDHLSKSPRHNYCIACERDFKDDNSLRNHLASKHGEEDSFLCKPCDRTFGSHQALQDHLAKSPRHNYCITCERDFKDDNSLRNHLASKHGEEDSFLCKPCDRTFGSHQALQDHLAKSPCHNYCIACDRDFKDDNSLCNHLASKHGEEDSFLCKLCDRTFGSHQALQEHLSKSPRHQAPLIFCPACRSSFVSAEALAKHMEKSNCYLLNNKKIVHKQKGSKQSNSPINITINITNNSASKESSNEHAYVCPIVDEGSSKMSHSSQHLDFVHELAKFQCHKCKSNYDPINVTTKATKGSSTKEVYSCAICGQSFCKLSSLSQHLDSNVHKPSEFRCHKCKRNNDPINVTTKAICSMCGRGFCTMESLRQHLSSNVHATIEI